MRSPFLCRGDDPKYNQKRKFVHLNMRVDNQIRIAIVDNHSLFRKGFANLVEGAGYPVVLKSTDGKDLISTLDITNLPHIVFMDVNMPEMDGYETAFWLKKNHPSIFVLALILEFNRDIVNKMMENGANGFILKVAEPSEIKLAIQTVIKTGFFYQNTDNAMPGSSRLNPKRW